MIATLLDPRYKILLEIDQVNHAKRECLKLLNGSDSSGEDETKRITSIVSASNSDSMEPQSKRPKVAGSGLSYVYRILEKKATKKIQSYLRFS